MRGRLIDAVVFDMDGTLVESHHMVPAAYAAFVHEVTGQVVTAEQVIALYPVGPPSILLAHLLGRPATPAEVARYHEHVRQLAGLAHGYAGLAEVLTVMSQRMPLAVFTGAATLSAQIMLADAGLDQHFQVVLGSDEVARVKPAPDGILQVCRQLGVPPSRVAYVGDSVLDAQAARAAGALAVAAGWGHMYRRDGASHDQQVDLVAYRPADLLALVTNPAEAAQGLRLA